MLLPLGVLAEKLRGGDGNILADTLSFPKDFSWILLVGKYFSFLCYDWQQIMPNLQPRVSSRNM